MLQALLAERFKLAVHRQSKEQSVYALVVGKNGPKLKESSPDAAAPAAEPAPGPGNPQVRITGNGENTRVVVSGGPTGTAHMSMAPNGTMHLEAEKLTLAGLADLLSRFVDRPVMDMTDLKGTYQVALDLTMEDMRNVARSAGIAVGGRGAGGQAGRPRADAASDPSGSSIFAAVQQLGLKLEPRKAPVDLIVIDHVEKTPTEN